jgi:hypothetical protein
LVQIAGRIVSYQVFKIFDMLLDSCGAGGKRVALNTVQPRARKGETPLIRITPVAVLPLFASASMEKDRSISCVLFDSSF